MTWLTTFASRLLALFRRRQLEEDLEDEVRFHLDMEIQENLRRGMSPEAARSAARRSFGGIDRAKESWRDRRWFPQIDQWLKDLRLAARNLARAPAFAAFSVLSLALGIGVNTAIFTMLRALVLQPLPYPEPWALVRLWETLIWQGESIYGPLSAPNLSDWRARNQVFENVGAFLLEGVNLAGGEGASRQIAALVEPDVFPIMRIQPLLGRTFLPHENRSGSDRVVILGHGLWQRNFAADPGIVGRELRINGAGHVVVGIMPPGFQFPPRSPAELWTPLSFNETVRRARGSHWLQVIARMKPGVSWLAAQSNLNDIARRLAKDYPDTNTARGARVEPLHLQTVRGTAEILFVLSGAVGVVLLLSCANVAHLVLARSAGRRRELAVRIALGAGRWRIVRLLTLESALVAGMGGLTAFFAARWCLDALLAFAGDRLPPGVAIQPDAATLWFCALVSLFSVLLAGLIPALRVSRIDTQSALKEAGASAGIALRRSRSALMVCEVALALVLAVGAMLLVRSLRILSRLDLGFRADGVLTVRVALPDAAYPRLAQTVTFFDGLLDQLRSIPRVDAAGVINCLPIQPWSETRGFAIQGRAVAAPGQEPGAELRRMSPGYFQAMGIPLLAGRFATQEDNREGAQRIVLVSRELARRYFPNENPVGANIRFSIEGQPGEWITIAGIVGDVRDRGVYRLPPAVIYEPYAHSNFNWTTMSLVVRAAADPESLAPTVRRMVADRDPDASVFLVKTMEQVVSDSVSGTRLLSRLLTIFGALALAMAVVGVFGVMSYLVSQRTHEIGVRMAMGARRREVVRMVLERGLRNALLGGLVGLAWTVLVGAAMRRFVIGIPVIDPWTWLLASSTILAAVLAATLVPAWRASGVDPLLALRDE